MMYSALLFSDEQKCFLFVFILAKPPHFFWLLLFYASHCVCLYKIYGLKEIKSCITIITDV